jgi:uncharacterized protein (TIGR02145 family)
MKDLNQIKSALFEWIKSREHSPIKEPELTFSDIEHEVTESYYATYEIFHETRGINECEKTHKHGGPSRPKIDIEDVNQWSYNFNFDSLHKNQTFNHFIVDSEYYTHCHSCGGRGEVNCYTCSGNGKCNDCKGRGNVKCKSSSCANGRCKSCAGRGEKRCWKCAGQGYEYGKKCVICNGSRVNNCSDCSSFLGNGTGNCKNCKGHGTIDCSRCNGSGSCGSCNGTGKNECRTCYGSGWFEHYLELEVSFINDLKSKKWINNSILPIEGIDLGNHVSDTDCQKLISAHEKEFSLSQLSSITNDFEVNTFLVERKKNTKFEKYHGEKINLYKIPIYIVKYKFDGKSYESYFVGDSLRHYYKSNPIEDYNIALEDSVKCDLTNEKYSSAYNTASILIQSYSSMKNTLSEGNMIELREKAKIKLQQEIGKGGLYAQLLISLIVDPIAIWVLSTNLKEQPSENFIIICFIILSVAKWSLYYSKTAFSVYFNKTDSEIKEAKKFIQGDNSYTHYFIENNFLSFINFLSIPALFTLWIMGDKVVFIYGILSIVGIYIVSKVDVKHRKNINGLLSNNHNSKLPYFSVIGYYHLLIQGIWLFVYLKLITNNLNSLLYISSFLVLSSGLLFIFFNHYKNYESATKISEYSKKEDLKKTILNVSLMFLLILIISIFVFNNLGNSNNEVNNTILKTQPEKVSMPITEKDTLTIEENINNRNLSTIKFGNQKWQLYNLDVSTFRNGDVILEATSNEDWENASNSHTPAWCYYKDDNGVGKLYNWYAVIDKRGLAPEGFHIPNNEEVWDMFRFFGCDQWSDIQKQSDLANILFNKLLLLKLDFRYESGSFSENSAKDASTFWTTDGYIRNDGESKGSDWGVHNGFSSGPGAQVYNAGCGFFVRCVKGEKSLSNDESAEVQNISMNYVTIGNQNWLAKNLDVSEFNNGNKLIFAKTRLEWDEACENKQGAYCYSKFNSENESYGKIYNWYAVKDSRKLAPIGWHIPNDKEWDELTENLGGFSTAGLKLKSTNKWSKNNGDNSSKFNALPAGSILQNFESEVGREAWFWSIDQGKTENSDFIYVNYRELDCFGNNFSKSSFTLSQSKNHKNIFNFGMAVRCIKD